MAKPFVKWAGGKGYILTQLEELLPFGFDKMQDVTYIEPFVGGGAMLFHMLTHHKNIRRVIINDINPDLVRCYQLIKENPNELIERLERIEKSYYLHDAKDRKELYYIYRDRYNQKGLSKNERATLFMFLNKTCFNGLYRVNTSGLYNVPFGRYQHPVICNKDLIMEDHRMLNSVETVILSPGNYSQVSRNLSHKGTNFLYFDPPYRPLLNESNFRAYSNSPFGDQQQEELKIFCDILTQKACLIMLSKSESRNADGSSYFEELYDGYGFTRILAPRFINAFPKKRVRLSEVVLTNYNRYAKEDKI